MGKDEIFIKNPSRRRVVVETPKPYVSEHKRLGIEPIPRGDFSEDFEKNAAVQKKEAIMKQREREKIEAVKKFRDGELSREQLTEFLGTEVQEDAAQEYKHQLVSSGQNDELSWLDQPIASKKVYDEEISEEDVPEETISVDEEFSFSDVKTGEYILLSKEGVLGYGNKKKLLEILNDLIENSEDGDISGFTLLKRVNLKFGLHFDDC